MKELIAYFPFGMTRTAQKTNEFGGIHTNSKVLS
jgi:hypothetical protein